MLLTKLYNTIFKMRFRLLIIKPFTTHSPFRLYHGVQCGFFFSDKYFLFQIVHIELVFQLKKNNVQELISDFNANSKFWFMYVVGMHPIHARYQFSNDLLGFIILAQLLKQVLWQLTNRLRNETLSAHFRLNIAMWPGW